MRSEGVGKAPLICRASRGLEKAGQRRRGHRQRARPAPTQRGTRDEKGRAERVSRGVALARGKAEAADRGRRKRRTGEGGSGGPRGLCFRRRSRGGRLRAMAALGRQVSAWCHLIPLTWARISRQTPQKKMMASLLRTLTTASTGGGLEGIPCGGPKKCVQDPECRTQLPQCLLEKHSAPVDRGSWEREEVITSLLDMGFSDAHVNELLTVQPGTHPQQLLDIVSELILLGVNPEPVCVALKKSPQLLKLPVLQMKKRSSYLRKLGLGEGKLRRVLHCCPEILTMRQRDIANTVSVLRDKCLFTVQQVTEILHRCPYVLREDPGELEYKFQYAYFRMGLKHADVVRTDFLQYSITKTRQRHTFLERLGRYQTPDKKGQTQVPNPPLRDILRVSEAEFLARTACSSAEEFEVFKKLLAREEEEESENHMPGDKSTSEDEEDEDGEEEGER